MTTPLPGSVQTAPNNTQGFDSDSVISATTAAAFANEGYQFCIRYLSLSAQSQSGDLTIAEASDIVNNGLALMAVQHVLSAGWTPSQPLGQEYGTNAANHAISIGFPKGVNIWLDLEGINAQTSAQAVIDYCTAWYNAVHGVGFVPGIYVGASVILSGQQLYDLPFQHYWQSASKVPALPQRGYQMQQFLYDEPVNGISIDKDTIHADHEGGLPLWLIVGN